MKKNKRKRNHKTSVSPSSNVKPSSSVKPVFCLPALKKSVFSHKAASVLRNVFFYLIFSVLLLLAISFVNHQIKLNEEYSLITPVGKKIMVNSHYVNVYSQGSGDTPLIFLAGSGTCSPVLDFKALTSRLKDDYRTVVVERAGYGFSEVSKTSRDIDTVLEETRTALQTAKIGGPYVLYAHSMAGLEAIYWAQKYPEEVTAIIGLDCAVPESYDSYSPPGNFRLSLLQLAARCGVTRFIPSLCEESAALTGGYLTEKEAAQYRALFYKMSMTADMAKEIKMLKSNAQTVKENGFPTETPMYFFVTDGSGVGIQNWEKTIKDYASQLGNAQITELNCGHYVQDFEPELIAQESSAFIKQLLS